MDRKTLCSPSKYLLSDIIFIPMSLTNVAQAAAAPASHPDLWFSNLDLETSYPVFYLSSFTPVTSRLESESKP